MFLYMESYSCVACVGNEQQKYFEFVIMLLKHFKWLWNINEFMFRFYIYLISLSSSLV